MDVDLNEDVEVISLDSDNYYFDDSYYSDCENDAESLDNKIIDEIEDLSIKTFIRHSKSIFSCDLNKDFSLALTGSEDDTAYVWSPITCEILFECTGHKDSVTHVSFSNDNELVATGDMSGLVQVWNVKSKMLLWCHEIDELEWMMWHPTYNILSLGCQLGNCFFWKIPQYISKALPSHGAPCTCGQILPDGKHIITGYGDGQVKFWDIKSANALWQYRVVDKSSVTSLKINKDGTLVCLAPSGILLKTSVGKVIENLLLQNQTSIEDHIFVDQFGVLVTISLDGQICIWDIAKYVVKHQIKLNCPLTVLINGQKGVVLIGGTDGVIYICDVRSGTITHSLTGHGNNILSLCLSTDGTKLLSTSDDCTAKIFNIPY